MIPENPKGNKTEYPVEKMTAKNEVKEQKMKERKNQNFFEKRLDRRIV